MCAHLRYASTMARFLPYTCLLAILVCVWYGVMYGNMRYGDMHGVAYNILVFRRPVALLLLVCVILAPCTSLVTFVRCPSRVRGMTCNILVRLPF